ncbi:MAG: Gfo/Idh/MocA family oxidoreductase [Acidobacteriota bacterium]|nr:Gfo/Idh/MocA family oxidoreductase [Acidobacteriota bacterium]
MHKRQPVRWGIIGAGDISHRVMAPAMRATECSELVAVMRTTQAGAEEFAREHGARSAYDNVESLVRDPEVEAVYVSTPVDRHCPDTLAAAAHGKHVLCEKPLALSVAEGEAMRQACRAAGVTFMTCYYQRFSARHSKIREIIQRGGIGRVTAVRWNFSGRYPSGREIWQHDPARAGGGPFTDLGTHGVDLMRFLVGEIVAVAAFVDTLVESYAVEDTASALLKFASGAQGVATAHWSTGDPDEHRNSYIEILGTDGVILSSPLHDKFSRGRLVVATEDGETSYDFDQSTHALVLEEFAAALAEGREPSITIEDGIRAQQTVEAVYESGRSGRVVELPVPPG